MSTDLVRTDFERALGAPTPERAAGAWLLGYTGHTRDAYATDLHQWDEFLHRIGTDPFDAHRSHVEAFARTLEARNLSPSTVSRRLTALSGFYRYCHQQGIVARNPVDGVRRPKVDDEAAPTGMGQGELHALIGAARAKGPRDHALVLLLGLNGLRIAQALGIDAEDLDVERGHRIVRTLAKGGKRPRVPLAPPTVEAVDTLLDGRESGPLFMTSTGTRLDRHSAHRTIAAVGRRAGLNHVTPHTLRHTFATLALDAGVALWVVQDACGHADPRTTQRYNRARHRLDKHPTYLLAGKVL